MSLFNLVKPSALQRTKSAHVAIGSPKDPICLKRSQSSLPCVTISIPEMNARETAVGSPHPGSIIMGRCCICLESKLKENLTISGDVCGQSECTETFCSACFGEYLSERVSANRFALPPITCLACHGRIPTSSWKSFAGDMIFRLYEQNAQDALVVRCPGCDEMQSLAETVCLEATSAAKAIDCFISRSGDADIIRGAWSEFEMGKLGADQFLELLLIHGPPDIQDHEPEMRLAENGKPYTLLQFLEYYDGYKYTGLNNWYVDPSWGWNSWYSGNEDDFVDDSPDEISGPVNCHNSGCDVCGCLSEFDEFGDRVCWCDACNIDGCKFAPIDASCGGECHVCGCHSEFDALGDRICWCDACKVDGCKYLCDASNVSGCTVPLLLESGGSSIDVDCPSNNTDSSDETSKIVQQGKELWEVSTLWSPAKRVDENGQSYSLAQFEQWYGQKDGMQKWKATQISNITPILRLMGDVERRTALHLAYLRKNPKTHTPCCSQAYCFRCHVGTWHSGITCELKCATDLDVEVQFCPGCNVPTQRTEGCSSMVCPCGKYWHWEGGSDISDDDY